MTAAPTHVASEPAPVLQSGSFVFLGSFNPAIFDPTWLHRNDLISEAEADFAQTRSDERADLIVTSQLTQVDAGWCQIDVRAGQLKVETKEPSKFQQLRDLASGLLQTLSHTPVDFMGLNYAAAYAIEDEEHWHKAGHTFAPKELWSRHLKNTGLLNLSIRGKRPDCPADRFDIVTGPASLPKIEWGIQFAANQHYDLMSRRSDGLIDGEEPALFASTRLSDDWLDFVSFSAKLFIDALKYPEENDGVSTP